MSRRSAIVAGLLVLAIVALVCTVTYFVSPREPSYQGKTLSEWIAPFCRQTAKGLDAPGGPQHFEELEPVRQAVREMGSNGVPFLIARLNHCESGLHRTVRQLLEKQPYTALRLTDPNVSKIRAIRALANLGPDAEPAIPNLAAQMTDATLSEHAVYALSGMSAEGWRALVGQYTNVPGPLRVEISRMIVFPGSTYRGERQENHANEIPAGILIEGLSLIVNEAKKSSRIPPFQAPAIQRLGMYGPLASNAVPILMEVLDFHDSMTLQSTIIALGKIRSQPEVVVPALTNLLNDADPRIKMSAASALREFGYNVPFQPQVPRVIHPPPPAQTKERYF
jgi:hypothetical protein